MCVCVGMRLSSFSVCACLCVFLNQVDSSCAKPQLVSLTNPSCNSDISAPVLAGEDEDEEGEGEVGAIGVR